MPGVSPATADAFPFYPPFVDLLSNFTTIRAMDLTLTNHALPNDRIDWSERPLRSDRTYTIRGMPYEDVVQLANAAGVNLWFNIPYGATDGFVANLSAYMRDTLRPDLQLAIEVGNEIWGTLFPGEY